MNHFEQQFNRVCVSELDMKDALNYLNAISENTSKFVRDGMIVAAIISYYRPFTNNEGMPDATNTLPINLSKALSDPEQKLHEKIKDLRNKVIAHSEFGQKPVKRFANVKIGYAITYKSPRHLLEQLDHEAFKDLVYRIMRFCKAKAHKLNKRI